MANNTDPLLVDISNAFYTGNYQQCINLSEKIKKPSLEKDIFMYRSYLATNRYRVVMDEVSQTSSGDLLAVRLFADYLLNKNKFTDLMEIIEAKLTKSGDELHIIWKVIASIMYIHEHQFEEALRVLTGCGDLECQAMMVYVFLRINRLDLAKKILAAMTEKNDDDTLTQLAQAWFNLELGGEKLQDAHYIFDDFKDKFASSVLLLNNLAVCALGQGKFDDDTNGYLRDGLDKEANNYDLLVNFIFYSQQTDKNAEAVINRYLSMLKENCKSSELVEDLAKKEAEFDRLCQNYSFKEAPKITS